MNVGLPFRQRDRKERVRGQDYNVVWVCFCTNCSYLILHVSIEPQLIFTLCRVASIAAHNAFSASIFHGFGMIGISLDHASLRNLTQVLNGSR